MDLRITLGDVHICILMYADDIVFVSENEQKLQTVLVHVNKWYYKWQMKVNAGKTKIVHFNNERETKTNLRLQRDFK